MGLPRHEEEEFARIAAGLPELDSLDRGALLPDRLARPFVVAALAVVIGQGLMVASIAVGAWPLAIPSFLVMLGVVSGAWRYQRSMRS